MTKRFNDLGQAWLFGRLRTRVARGIDPSPKAPVEEGPLASSRVTVTLVQRTSLEGSEVMSTSAVWFTPRCTPAGFTLVSVVPSA